MILRGHNQFFLVKVVYKPILQLLLTNFLSLNNNAWFALAICGFYYTYFSWNYFSVEINLVFSQKAIKLDFK